MIEAETKFKFSLEQVGVTDMQNNMLFDFVAWGYIAYTKKTKSTRTYQLGIN